MPEDVGYPNESTQERKQRIKKLKAKTSKMRLSNLDPAQNDAYWKQDTETDIQNSIEIKAEKHKAELKNIGNRPDRMNLTNMRNNSDLRSAAVKKKKKEYDQDGENEHNRDNYNAQSSVETGGDY